MSCPRDFVAEVDREAVLVLNAPAQDKGVVVQAKVPGASIGYCGALTTTYVTDDPENFGWYQADPHC